MAYDWFKRGAEREPGLPELGREMKEQQEAREAEASEPKVTEDDSLAWAREAYARLKTQQRAESEPTEIESVGIFKSQPKHLVKPEEMPAQADQTIAAVPQQQTQSLFGQPVIQHQEHPQQHGGGRLRGLCL